MGAIEDITAMRHNVPRWSLLFIAVCVADGIYSVSPLFAQQQWVEAVTITAVSGLTVLCVILWADRFEPEPPQLLLWAFLWGAAVADLSGYLNALISLVIDHPSMAALVEEPLKLMGVILMARTVHLHAWTDGFVFGAMAGLGFTILEDLNYAAWSENPVEVTFTRSVASVFAHTMFSGVVGGFLAQGLISSQRSRVVTAVGAAVGVHAFWNYLIFVEANVSFAAFVFLPPAFTIVAAIWHRTREKQEIARLAHLRDPALFDFDHRILWDLRFRRQVRAATPRQLRPALDLHIRTSIRNLIHESR